MEKMSKSLEDYLEAMVELGATVESPIRSVDVAAKMGVSKASVNKAMAVLKERGFAEQPYYGDITLTEAGYEYGMAVLERHNMLYTFLTKALGIPEDRADEEACLMEHAISDESFEKWFEFVRKLNL